LFFIFISPFGGGLRGRIYSTLTIIFYFLFSKSLILPLDPPPKGEVEDFIEA
jgi:hypothetical protein